jgi:hypothetical protein
VKGAVAFVFVADIDISRAIDFTLLLHVRDKDAFRPSPTPEAATFTAVIEKNIKLVHLILDRPLGPMQAWWESTQASGPERGRRGRGANRINVGKWCRLRPFGEERVMRVDESVCPCNEGCRGAGVVGDATANRVDYPQGRLRPKLALTVAFFLVVVEAKKVAHFPDAPHGLDAVGHTLLGNNKTVGLCRLCVFCGPESSLAAARIPKRNRRM